MFMVNKDYQMKLLEVEEGHVPQCP